ncbi:MAG: Trk system potassium transporter TrkA [Candidatus Paracaedibacteraceae bacterium]|nr:Trk system potassium transporter TrkA [Candidatus Paracaedibacteraceae bacterium]
MKVIILGAGQVGYSIARYLANEENDITVVDHSPEVLKRISDKIDVKPIVGFASHPNVLQRANAESADLLIAVTASDEVNMVACEVAHSMFGVKTKMARIRHENYLIGDRSSYLSKNMSIDVTISPEVEVAKSLARSARIAGAFEVISLVGDQIKIIGVRCHSRSLILNTPLRLLSTQFTQLDIIILCVYRNDVHFFPKKDDVLEVDDEVYFVVRQEDVESAMEAFGYFTQEKRKIIIVGGGNIGLGFAQELEAQNTGIKVKIIEKNTERSEIIAHVLKSTEVLNGDALDLDVLTEANVQDAETILALTDDDRVNILVSLLAKRQGAKRATALLNKMTYASLVTSLGVDAIISPRVITVSTILQYVFQGRVRTIHSLAGGYAEVIEAEARETSYIIGLTIEDITVRDSIYVAAVVRNNDVILNPRRLIVGVGDVLVMMVKRDSSRKVEKLFSIRPSYL